MGHKTDLFLDSNSIDDEFLCSICQDVLEDPVVALPCEHLYCKSCIKKWHETSKTCAVDRGQITELGSPLRGFVNLLNKLELHCKFNGCESTFPLGDLKLHEEKCNHNPLKGVELNAKVEKDPIPRRIRLRNLEPIFVESYPSDLPSDWDVGEDGDWSLPSAQDHLVNAANASGDNVQ